MLVKCDNCGGSFEDSETKCPYCGMIYEPGAERAFSEKLELIRRGLDEVDGIVVTDFKENLKRFFRVFAISLLVVLAFALFMEATIYNSKKKEKAKYIADFNDNVDMMVIFEKGAKRWNELYEAGNYEEMCTTIDEERMHYNFSVSYWEHYDFYSAYSSYLKGQECVDYTRMYTVPGAKELSRALFMVFSLYSDVEINSYNKLTYSEKALLGQLYEKLSGEIKDAYGISAKDFEAMKDRLTNGNKSTYISSTECDAVAKERLGE